MHVLLQLCLSGLGLGAMISLLAVGIVVIFKGTGVINIAQGAIGMVAAFLYREARVVWHLSTAVSLLMILACALVFGAAIQLLVMKQLTRAPILAKVVATLGILLGLQGAAQIAFDVNSSQAVSVLPQTGSLWAGNVSFSGLTVAKSTLWLAGLAIVLVVGFWLLYRYTWFGLVSRASAQNPVGAILLGYSPNFVGLVSWMLGSVLAALSGILIAPIIQLSTSGMTLLVIPALAAAVSGRFASLIVVLVVGLLIGSGESYLTYFTSIHTWLESGWVTSFPFIVIIVVMMLSGQLIPARGTLETQRPPRSPSPSRRAVPPGWAALFLVAGLVVCFGGSDFASAVTQSLLLSTVGLSVVVVTGYAGQISLAQMALAGIGAYITSKFAYSLHLPLLLVLPMAGVVAAVTGVIIGLPAVRVRGVSLAVMTLGAGLAIQYLILQSFKLSGGFAGNPVTSPNVFGLSLDANAHPQRFAVLCLCVFGILAIVARNYRRSRSGRRSLAMRANERSASAMGIELRSQKLGAFVLAAFIAGVAGSLTAYETATVTATRYTALDSILVVALVYAGSIGSIQGAAIAGLGASQGIVQWVIGAPGFFAEYAQLVSGLFLLVVLVQQPDGTSVFIADRLFAIRKRFSHGSDRHGKDAAFATNGAVADPAVIRASTASRVEEASDVL